jgi:DNA-binding transcriptional regulator YhcF (GntR family)
MNFNFTNAVRQALAHAREEAIRLQHDHVGTEHILLGVIGDPQIATLLGEVGVKPDEIRMAVSEKVRRGTASRHPGEIPYTLRAKKVLELAMREARERREAFVTTEHLLLAVFREEKGVGATVLREFGLLAEKGGSFERRRTSKGSAGFRVRLDDASDRSIYEQIVAQVTEAVATRNMSPGDRLPTVRQLADELDIAPGTVARAYGELERQGVVVTDGARGTRIAERPVRSVEGIGRAETLAGLLRPVAVAAFQLGSTANELRSALDQAMRGIFDKQDDAA